MESPLEDVRRLYEQGHRDDALRAAEALRCQAQTSYDRAGPENTQCLLDLAGFYLESVMDHGKAEMLYQEAVHALRATGNVESKA